MAKPQIKRTFDQMKVGQLAGGFNKLVRDFDRAIFLAKLDPAQGFLVQRAREASWMSASLDNRPDPYPFILPISELARLYGIHRTSMSRHHSLIVDMRIFVLFDPGSSRNRDCPGYLINKDFRRWIDKNGLPLLSPFQIEDCLSVVRRPKPSHPVLRSGTTDATVDVHPVLRSGTTDATVVHNPEVQTVAEHATVGAVPPDPHRGTSVPAGACRRELNLRESLESLESKQQSAAALLPDGDLFPIHDGPYSPSEPEAIETLRLSRSLVPGNSIPEEIWQAQRIASATVWQAAIREAARSQPSGVRMFRYVLAIASRFESDGIPAVHLSAVSRPDQKPGDSPGRSTKAERDSAKLDRQRAAFAAERAHQSMEVSDGQG